MKTIEKIVLITDAAGGNGRVLTQRFLDDDAKVCAIDISIEALEKLSDNIGTQRIYSVL